jgi:signal transduction histidine kinase
MELPKIPDHESERLKALQSYDILDTLEEEDFNNLAKLASEICQTPISVISFVDSNRQWFKSAVGLNAKETSRDISFCGHAINNSNDILIIEDARNDLRFNDNPLVTGDPNIVFYAGTPLVDENGMALGTLCVIDSVPRKLSSAQLNTLQILSKSIVDLLKIRRQTKMIEKEKLFLIESLEFSSPYFLIVDKNGIITEFGKNYKKSIQSLQKNMLFSDVFNWISKIDFEQINDSFQYQNKLLFFETKDKKQKYKCSIKISFDNKYILCVVPVINTEYPISNFKININDFPKQDYIAEYLFLQQAATRGLEDSKRLNDLLNIKNKDLEISKNALIEANNVLEKRIFERTNTIKNLALFPEQNPNPVFEIDFVNENLIYINPAAKDIFGFDLKSDFLEVCSAIHLNKQNYHLPAINKNEFQFNDLVFQYNIFIVKGQETARIYLHNITEIRTIEKEEKAKQEILLQFRSIDHSLNFSEKIKIINSTSANFLNVEQNTSITSNSIYLKEKNKQSEGLTFLSSDYPRYFKNVLNEPFLFASDAHVHPATSEFSETYLKPLGITSTLDIPIMNSGFIIGVICNEYFTKKDNYTASELNFMRSVADSVALIFESEKVISSKEELKRKNDSLTDAYEKLIEMQSEIIKQDKLATLGTLIAGIAHEVNTPLGAIKASNDSINQALANNFNFNLEEINQEELALVFQLTNTRIKTTKQLSTRDERILIKTISEELIQKFPTMNDPQFYAKKITEFGYHTADSCFDLFIKHKKASQFFEMASNLVNLARSSDNILLAVNKASRVVKSLNLFSHTNSSKERQNFKLKENFENVETILWNRIKNGSNLVINIDDDLEIFGNPDEISQVWTNIINNAIQACDSKAEILIQYRKEDNYHTIIIENNGPKIPNEVINKIFDPFFSTKKRGEGTGLGLHIVKKIIDNHNGEIVCKSSDLSTQFIIKLPVK